MGLQGFPGVGQQLAGIVASDAITPQRLGQALDAIPAELDAGRHHQQVVAEGVAAAGGDRGGVRIKGHGGGLNPAHPLRNQIHFGPTGLRQGKHPGSHQGPSRLVVVVR
jgi:hypothetical protein